MPSISPEQFELLIECEKLWNLRTWIEEEHGGNRRAALDWIAEHCGLGGRGGAVEYMYSVLAQNPELRDYSLFEKFLSDSYRRVHAKQCEELKFCERAVPAEIAVNVTPDVPRYGNCYEEAYLYLKEHHEIIDGSLVHGTIRISTGHVPHAWVEINGEIIFDGAIQRFYDAKMYRMTNDAVELARYSFEEARDNLEWHEFHGAWHEEDSP